MTGGYVWWIAGYQAPGRYRALRTEQVSGV